jgi:hypothetical protein
LDFDIQSGYFDSKALINASSITLSAFVILILSFGFVNQSNKKFIPQFNNVSTIFVSVLSAGSLVFLIIEFFKNIYGKIKSQTLFENALIGTVLILCLIFAICAFFFFVLNVLREKRRSGIRAYLAIGAVLFFAFYTAFLYFDTTLPLNAPNKLIDECAYLFAAVFFLYETRLSLGREKWNGYVTFGFLSSLLCAYSSIPSLIYYIVNGESVSNSEYESIFTFAIFIYVAVRTLLTEFLTEDKISPKVQCLIDASNSRAEEIKKTQETTVKEEENEEILKNQIAISDFDDIDKTITDEEKEELEKQELLEKIENLPSREDG